MRQLPVIVSHYTIDTPYQKEVEKLRASLERFQLEHWIQGIESLGSWRYNSNYCAQQIKDALGRFPGRNILRVDADAVFHMRPSLLECDDFKADVSGEGIKAYVFDADALCAIEALLMVKVGIAA